MKKAAIKVLFGKGVASKILRDERGEVSVSGGEQRELLRVVDEIEHRSITPTTLDERLFEENLDNFWFTDKYRCNGLEIVRFGINDISSQIIDSITTDGIKTLDIASRATSTLKSTCYRVEDLQGVQLASLKKAL